MEEQDKLEMGVGTKEAVKLEVAPVKVMNVIIKKVGENMEKAVLIVKHPAQEDCIEISSAKYEKDNQIKVTGLWFKQDSDGKLQKGSALATMVSFYKVENLKALIGKELNTTTNDKKYLMIKAY